MLTTTLNGKKLNLIQNIEELRWLRKEIENSKTVGIDTETTGLSFIKDRMVGLCITACRPMQGFYLPVRHVIGNNLPLDEVVEIAQYAISNKKTMFFNRNYDTTMLELDGCYIPYNADMHDVQVMCWEATNEKFPALKKFAKNYLKWKVIDFGETAGTDEDGNANHNFGETDPEQSYIYAAMDPIMTVELGRYMWNTYPYIRKIYPVDNLVTEAVRRMGKVDVQIDYKRLGELSEEANKELRSLRQQIIQMVGYEFNIGSNRQKAEALSRFVTLSVKTKGGDFSVKDEVLQEIDHPLAGLLLDFSKKSKFINSFIKPLSLMEGKPVHFNFKTVEVPTGRMAAGQVRGNDYFARLNVQALPKKKVHRFLHEGSDLGYYLDDNPEGSLGDQEVKAGFRDCFKAPDGYVFVSADFCGEEINICANLSGDDTWCNAINDGKDIHMECYSDDTEILTDKGFVLFKDLKKDHKVAEFCDGKFHFTNDYTISVYDYKGKMCHFKTKVTDILVTPNHRMYGRTDKTNPYRIQLAKDVKNLFISRNAEFDGISIFPDIIKIPCSEANGRKYADEISLTKIQLFRLLGLLVTDGHVRSNKNTIFIYQSEANKKFEKVKSFVESLPIKWNLEILEKDKNIPNGSNGDVFIWSFSHKELHRLIQKLIGNSIENKFIHRIIKFEKEEFLKEFFEFAILGDGSIDKREGRNNFTLCSGSEKLADDFQFIAMRLGYGTRKIGKERKWRVLCSSIKETLIKRPDYKDYDSKVYCVTVKSGLLIVRRNGCISVCGNSAKKVFGIADKEKRGIVKTCSFLIIYGGGEFTLSKRLKVPLQEAKNMFNAFHVGMPKVTRWIKYTIDQARRKGILFTYYGRPRLLFQYYSSPDPKKHSFADRSAVNTLCQGCIPTNLHIELKNKAVYFASHLGSKFTLADGREAITSGRRTGLCYLILTKSGDFAIADENHGFVHGSKKKPLYRRVCEGLNVKIRTSKLQSKMFPNIFELKNLFTASGRKKVKSTLMALTMKDEVVKNRRLSTYFFICWLLKLPLNFKDIHRAASMRSIASVFGFNLKMDVSSDIQCLEKADYYLHWFRKSKTIVVGVRKLDVENIGSMTLTSGYQIYPTQGFLNKNTGADIMRILLCKFFQRKNDDSEFNANVELGWHVHDEINVYVKKEYLFKFFYILRDLMWVRNSNWRTDLKSDIGIGTNWGNGINAIGVTPEGTLIIKGLNDTPEVMERTRIAVKEAGLKWDDDLGLKRI